MAPEQIDGSFGEAGPATTCIPLASYSTGCSPAGRSTAARPMSKPTARCFSTSRPRQTGSTVRCHPTLPPSASRASPSGPPTATNRRPRLPRIWAVGSMAGPRKPGRCRPLAGWREPSPGGPWWRASLPQRFPPHASRGGQPWSGLKSNSRGRPSKKRSVGRMPPRNSGAVSIRCGPPTSQARWHRSRRPGQSIQYSPIRSPPDGSSDSSEANGNFS